MYKIEMIIRVVNQHGDTVDMKGQPAMIASQHVLTRIYPEKFSTAAEAYKELEAVPA